MFQVDDYQVEFYHCHDPKYDKKNSLLGVALFWTECTIYRGNETFVSGVARCHPNDSYNRNIGRKVSLAKALKILTKDRELRKRFWDAYFAARNGKH